MSLARQAPDHNSNVLDSPGTPRRQGARGQYIGVHCLREFLVDIVGVTGKRDDKSAGTSKKVVLSSSGVKDFKTRACLEPRRVHEGD
jgi:hypothetical protein